MGCITPVLSVVEDIGVIAGIVVALLAPMLVLFISLVLVVLFILFAPSQPDQTQIIPFPEVQALKLKKMVSQGTLAISTRARQDYTCTILRTTLDATTEITNVLYTHYHLPFR